MPLVFIHPYIFGILFEGLLLWLHLVVSSLTYLYLVLSTLMIGSICLQQD